ncbi:DUF3047 domain-containing protein [Colwellia sp. C1TZA3]|uniref:DUF3047 domain-containing protein n=1 Tax=Colwellia sp. C1TZA3 TaxID=2508879 RepID=UPI0011BA31AE|nr:DUF3047 domain-containing protein [Colwellia sp. C1TZA3]TWX71368.1 DUF3047 domain-containing protein [Colwellia sp. C1TZA3]
MIRWIFLLVSVIACWNVKAFSNLTSLNNNGIEQWEVKVFSGKSIYTINQYQGRFALQALSQSSASGLVLKKKIDLTVTPYINWSWLVEKTLHPLNERSKSGDDFVARIYVVIDGGFMVWQTKSLNYVWSSNQDIGLVWDNPFAGSNVKMMSIQGKESKTGKWYQEKRNVYKDLIDTFGDQGSEKANLKAYNHIDIIAIMTDTDNSEKAAESYYGDIVFSAG